MAKRQSKSPADLPLYADLPDLFSFDFVQRLMGDLGIDPPSYFDLHAHAQALRRAVRTAMTLANGRVRKEDRDWHKKVAEQANQLKQLLGERTIMSWSACLFEDVLSPAAQEAEEAIGRLPSGLDLLARAAEASAGLKNSGGRPAEDLMRRYLFSKLVAEFETVTGLGIKARISGLKADPQSLAMRWTRAVLKHAEGCYATAPDDAFGSRDQAERLRYIVRLSDASLVDLLEKGRADYHAGHQLKPPFEIE